MNFKKPEIILIGGSAGSILVIKNIMDALPVSFDIPIVIVLHRMKNVNSDLKSVLSARKIVQEPEDKDSVKNGGVYLAPQNYHLLIEEDHSFSMDYSELVNYSRPSIDVTFISASKVYKGGILCILLSGANNDGAEGVKSVLDNGGQAIIQDPETAESTDMPESAIKLNATVEIQSPEKIVNTLLFLHTQMHTI